MSAEEASNASGSTDSAPESGPSSSSRLHAWVAAVHKTVGLGTGLVLLPWTIERYDISNGADWKPLAANAIAITTIATGKSLVDVLKAVVKPR